MGGYAALPTLWRTFIAEERGWLTPLVLAGALGTMMWRAYLAEKHYLVVLGAALLVVQGLGTFYIRETTAHALFSFGGDGMGMVIATALMATFFFGKRTQLYKGWLRWGFLAIGAAAFSDMFATCLAALALVYAWGVRQAWRELASRVRPQGNDTDLTISSGAGSRPRDRRRGRRRE